MQRVVVLECFEGSAADVGQFVFFALACDGLDEQKGQHDNDYRNTKHVQKVLDKRVFFEEVCVHNER